jgi:hypothetical protein
MIAKNNKKKKIAKIQETFDREVDVSDLESKIFEIEIIPSFDRKDSVAIYYRNKNICTISLDAFMNGSRSGSIVFYESDGRAKYVDFYNLDLYDLVRCIKILYEEDKKTYQDISYFGQPQRLTKEESVRKKRIEKIYREL